MQYKFKQLNKVNTYSVLSPIVLSLPPAVLLTRYILGPFWKRLGNNRPQYLFMSFFWPLFSYGFYQMPIPRRLYT